MRYKFNIPHHIKDWCEWQLKYYRESKMQLEQLKNEMIPSAVPKYSESIGSSEATRTTEDVAMKILSSPYIRQLEITVDGITRALDSLDDIDILNEIYDIQSCIRIKRRALWDGYKTTLVNNGNALLRYVYFDKTIELIDCLSRSFGEIERVVINNL